mgnify:CR=1 FL=1
MSVQIRELNNQFKGAEISCEGGGCGKRFPTANALHSTTIE